MAIGLELIVGVSIGHVLMFSRMPIQRVLHTLTAHHWRHDHGPSRTKIMYCSCGWQCRFVRRHKRATHLRAITKLCWLRHHDWSDPDEVHAGPVGFEESADSLLCTTRQCSRCYTVKVLR